MEIPIMGTGLWKRCNPVDAERKARIEKCVHDTEIAVREQYNFTKEGYRNSGCPDNYRPLTEEEKERLIMRLGLKQPTVTESVEDKGIKRNLKR